MDRGYRLNIDRATVWNHPIAINKNLYTRYGYRAPNIAIDGVYPCDLALLFDHFPNVRMLTLKNVQIEGHSTIVNYPSTIHILRIINTRVNGMWLENFPNLHKLILMNCQWTPARVYSPSLKSLTLIGMEMDWNFRCANLKELTVEWYPKDLYEKLSQLDHLKVIQSVDPAHREAIEALNLKTVDIHYYDVPTEDTPIKRLNEDCFLYLRGFLSSDDWVSLRETLWCLQGQKIPKLTVNSSTVDGQSFPLHKRFYERIGPFVNHLEISVDVNCKDICTLLPVFVNLSELKLSLNYDEDEGDHRSVLKIIPSGLKSFSYDNEDLPELPQPEFDELLLRLNPTLHTLKITFWNETLTQSLRLLQNIRDFECYEVEVNNAFLFFLKSNKAQLRRFVGSLRVPPEINAEIWSTILEMDNLKALDIFSHEIEFPSLLSGGSLSKLRKLTLQNFRCVQHFLTSLVGSELIELCLSRLDLPPGVRHILRFQQLRRLQCPVSSVGDLLLLIKGLPQLIELDILEHDIHVDTLREICEYFRPIDRRFKLQYAGGCLLEINN